MTFDLEQHMQTVERRMQRRAERLPEFDGSDLRARLVLPRAKFDDTRTRTRIIFTRDVGHHACGWWKNPNYERCLHLSLSPFPDHILTPDQVADPTPATWRQWVEWFFGEHRRLLWFEPPFSDLGKRTGVQHWRLFCDAAWRPILPRGEVYSREFTERGWKSWSEAQEAQAEQEAERP